MLCRRSEGTCSGASKLLSNQIRTTRSFDEDFTTTYLLACHSLVPTSQTLPLSMLVIQLRNSFLVLATMMESLSSISTSIRAQPRLLASSNDSRFLTDWVKSQSFKSGSKHRLYA